MDSYLFSQNFILCKYDRNVNMLRTFDYLLLIVLYLDDLLITGISTPTISTNKTTFHDKFSMTYMDLLNFFLGLERIHNDLEIKISQ